MVGDTLYLDAPIDGRRASPSKPDRGVISQSLSLVVAGRGQVQHGQHVQMIRHRMAQPSSPLANSYTSDAHKQSGAMATAYCNVKAMS
jgi:hypothetical protein